MSAIIIDVIVTQIQMSQCSIVWKGPREVMSAIIIDVIVT